MEGATLGCPLTDRCQQRPSSSKHQVGCAISLTAGKDDDTEIAQSANADTHGAYTPFWTCHSGRSVGCEMRRVLKVPWLIKHRQERQVAALKLESPLSVPFSRWQADLWSRLTLIQHRSSPSYTGRCVITEREKKQEREEDWTNEIKIKVLCVVLYPVHPSPSVAAQGHSVSGKGQLNYVWLICSDGIRLYFSV